MRLWHECLLPYLPDRQLLGQHRECCALRGRGWGRRHRTLDYVFIHSPYCLFLYHRRVMNEMECRGFQPGAEWRNPGYRGRFMKPYKVLEPICPEGLIFPEHNSSYLRECIHNLKSKGIVIPDDIGKNREDISKNED